MKIKLRNNIDKLKYIDDSLEVDTTKSFNDLENEIKTYLKIPLNKKNISFVHISLDSNLKRNLIHDKTNSLDSLGFKTNDILLLEDLSIKISSRFIISFAYLGPILVFTYFLCNNLKNNDLTNSQIVSYVLVFIHYSKRILEVNFIHDYGCSAMGLLSLTSSGVILYYWILFGILVGYPIFHQKADKDLFSFNFITLIILFLLCESQNLRSHIILKNIKLQNKGHRGIPFGECLNMFLMLTIFGNLCLG